MTKSRLALLIDSLASGGEVFSSRASENGEMNEMDVVLNNDHNI
jgi:ribosome assembly protein 3